MSQSQVTDLRLDAASRDHPNLIKEKKIIKHETNQTNTELSDLGIIEEHEIQVGAWTIHSTLFERYETVDSATTMRYVHMVRDELGMPSFTTKRGEYFRVYGWDNESRNMRLYVYHDHPNRVHAACWYDAIKRTIEYYHHVKDVDNTSLTKLKYFLALDIRPRMR